MCLISQFIGRWLIVVQSWILGLHILNIVWTCPEVFSTLRHAEKKPLLNEQRWEERTVASMSKRWRISPSCKKKVKSIFFFSGWIQTRFCGCKVCQSKASCWVRSVLSLTEAHFRMKCAAKCKSGLKKGKIISRLCFTLLWFVATGLNITSLLPSF